VLSAAQWQLPVDEGNFFLRVQTIKLNGPCNLPAKRFLYTLTTKHLFQGVVLTCSCCKYITTVILRINPDVKERTNLGYYVFW